MHSLQERPVAVPDEQPTVSDAPMSAQDNDHHDTSASTSSATSSSMPPPAPAPWAKPSGPAPAAGTAAPWASRPSMPAPTGAPWAGSSRPAAPATTAGASTAAPWARPAHDHSADAAMGSHFPQLARPGGTAAAAGAVSSSRPNGLDTLNPTNAPFGTTPRSGHQQTGRPVAELITTEAHMPGSSEQHPSSFRPASKWITSDEDLRRFLASDTIKEFVGFIMAVSEAVKGTNINTETTVSAPVAALRAALDSLWDLVTETPPVQQELRYGNPAYRTWHARMAAAAPALLEAVLPPDMKAAVVELVPYFADSFGNATRIDYGTGHETTFVALLFCLAKLGVVQAADMLALVNHVFTRYLELMRRVQTTYWLEPAGSHGVWGLDDYQFLPFVWGSAQLTGHGLIRPKSITNPQVLEGYADAYMYLGCVKFVLKVKKGPLQETSPMLNDISGVKDWAKVNSGLLKMYQVEVLSKLPIMQHFLFGSLLPRPS